MAGRRENLDGAAAAARGEQPEAAKTTGASTTRNRTTRRATTTQQTTAKQTTAAATPIDPEEGLVSARNPGRSTPRAELLAKAAREKAKLRENAKVDERMTGDGQKTSELVRTLRSLHSSLVNKHNDLKNRLGSALYSDTKAIAHFGNAQFHLEDAEDSIKEAERIDSMWKSDALKTEFGTRTPSAAYHGHLHDAIKMLKAAHNQIDHKDLHGYTDKNFSEINPKTVSRLSNNIMRLPTKNWKSKPFRTFSFGRDKIVDGTAIYNHLLTEEGKQDVKTVAKNAGLDPKSILRKLDQTKRGTPKKSRKGKVRVLAIDPNTGKPFAKGHPRHGDTIIAEGPTPQLPAGARPDSPDPKLGDGRGVIYRNNRPRGMQPYEDTNKDILEESNTSGLTQQQRLENANAVAQGKVPPHNTGDISPITGLRKPSEKEAKAAVTRYKGSKKAKAPKKKDRTSAATKRAKARPGAVKRTGRKKK